MNINRLGSFIKKCKDVLITVSVASLLSTALITDASANPVISHVAAGNVSISQTPGTTVVNQASQRAIINWRSFNIKAGEKTQFIQPNARAAALNRIDPTQGASQIYGQLTANGQVILVNAAGIHFGPGAMVNVGSIIASTTDISDANFMAGKYIFDRPSMMGGAIINEGTIKAADYGLVALLGTNVQNSGYIQAKLGSIALGSGNKFTLDFYGDQLINFTVDEAATQTSTDESGQSIRDGVKNTGTLLADDGKILVTAQAAKGVLDRVINMEGVTQAKSVTQEGGVIILDGNGPVEVAGKLDASSDATKGGTVKVLGDDVRIASTAAINASGKKGGGEVLIGGNYQGKGSERNAKHTVVENGAVIKADAVQSGNGGKVIVWADDSTAFHGSISAKGGSENGDGGLVETSGHYLDVKNGSVDTRAVNGITGTWLLDPTDLTIANTSSSNILQPLPSIYEGDADQATSILDVNDLIAALNNSNIKVLTTAGGSGSGAGDITLAANILDTDWTNSTTLTLSAYRNININANISNSAGGSVVLQADNTGTGTGTVNFSGGTLSMTGDNSAVKIYYNPSSLDSPVDYSPNVSVTGLNSSLTAYMLINSLGTSSDAASAKTLGALSNNSSLWGYNFALGKDIDASATSSWNSGNGFSPIGSSSTQFTGNFDGQNHVINNLVINTSDNGGLFGTVNAATTINNIGLTNLNVSSGYFGGGLIGEANGGVTVSNVYTTGTVHGNYYSGGIIGYMDPNTTLENAYSTVSLDGSVYASGGLVGYLGTNSLIQTSYFGGSIDTMFGDIGGIAGTVVGGNILNTYNIGTLNNVYGANGGLVGSLTNSGTITNSYSSGVVYQDPTGNLSNVGGLVGSNGDSLGANVVDSYWDTDTSGQASSAGGTGLITSDALSIYNYNNWDIGTNPSTDEFAPTYTWFMNDGRTRPMLMMEWNTNVTNPHQVQLITTTLGANYTIGNDIDFSTAMNNLADVWATNRSTSTGLGFAQISSYTNGGFYTFQGTIDGQYHLLSNIYLSDNFGSFSAATGFVARLGQYGQTGGIIRRLGLSNIEVTSTNGSYDVGTMVGVNEGLVEQSFATGWIHNVGAYVGGLVGNNDGHITDSYADVYIANSSGSGTVVGLNSSDDLIVNTFGLGYASGSGFGDFDSAYGTNSFWNIDRSGTATNNGNIVGKTNAQLMQQATYTGYDFTNTWGIIEGQSYAYLKGFYPTAPQIISGTSDVAGGNVVNIALNGNTTNYQSFTGSDVITDPYGATTPAAQPGFYYIMLPNGTIPSGSYILSYLSGSTKGNAISVTNSVGSPGLNITANAISAGDDNVHNFSSADFATAAGSLKTALPNDILYTVTGSNITLDANTGFATTANTNYTLDGTIEGPNAGEIDGPISILGQLYLTQDTFLYSPTSSITVGNVDSISTTPYEFDLQTDNGSLYFTGAIGSANPINGIFAGASDSIIMTGTGIIADSNINLDKLSLGASNDVTLQSNTGNIQIGALTGNGANTLTINANQNILFNDNVDLPNGTLILNAANFNGYSIGSRIAHGIGPMQYDITVNNLILQQGYLGYSSIGPLPNLTVTNNFSLEPGTAYNNAFNAGLDRFLDNGSSYEIYDIYGLQGIATNNLDVTFVLMNDIDASGTANWVHGNGDSGFIPLSKITASSFGGIFDGNYHIIDSLYINSSYESVGLFGTLSGANISNLGLTNVSINASVSGASLTGYAFVGGLAGYVADTVGSSGAVPSNISNVFVTGQVNLTSNTNLSQTGVGGLVGSQDQLAGSNTSNITNSYSTAIVSIHDVYTGSTTIHNIGGLVGLLAGNVAETYSTGAVSVTTDPSFAGTVNIGGLIGNTGDVFGYPVSNSVTDSYYNTESSGQTTSAGGTGKTTAEMKQQATFTGFDFSTPVWGIVENTITPYLYGFYGSNPPIPTLISGVVQGGSAGLILQLISGGSVLGSTTTNSGGAYTFSINSTFTNGQPILVYVSGSSFLGNLVTYATGTTQTLSAIFSDTLSIDNNFENISNAYLGTLKGGLSSADILYGVTGTDLTIGNLTHSTVNFITSAATNYDVDGNISGVSGGNVSMTFNGAVNLTTDANILAEGGRTTFNSTVDGAQVLTTGNDQGVTFNGNVGSNTALNSLYINTYNGAVDKIGANITTDYTQDYGNAVQLSDTNGTAINLTSNYDNINFHSTIDNDSASAAIDLSISTGGGTHFYNNVGANQALNSLDLAYNGSADTFGINTDNGVINSINTIGSQTYNNYFNINTGSGASSSAIVHFVGGDISFNDTLATGIRADVTIDTEGNSLIYNIGDLHSLTKEGNGVLNIVYNGSSGMTTYVNAGTLVINDDYALGTQNGSDPRLVVNGGTVALNSNLDIGGNGDTFIMNDGTTLISYIGSVIYDASSSGTGHIALSGNVTFGDGNGNALGFVYGSGYANSVSIDSLTSSAPATLTTWDEVDIGKVGLNTPLNAIIANGVFAAYDDIQTVGDQTYNNTFTPVSYASGPASSRTVTGNNLQFSNILLHGPFGGVNLILNAAGNNNVINGNISTTAPDSSAVYQNNSAFTFNGNVSSSNIGYFLNGGSLTVSSADAFKDMAGFTMSGATLNLNNIALNLGSTSFSYDSGTIQAAGTSSISGTDALLSTSSSGTMNFNIAGSLTINLGVSVNSGDSVVFDKTGAGTLILAAANQFSGGSIDAGLLSITNSNAFGAGQYTVGSGAELNLNNVNVSGVDFAFNGGVISVTGNSAISNSAISMIGSSDATFTAGNGSVLTINSDVGGSNNMNLSGLGIINFTTNLGSIGQHLNSITSTVANLGLSGNVITQGLQSYTGLLTLNNNVTLSNLSNQALNITGGISAAGRNLIINGGLNNTFTLSGTLLANNITVAGNGVSNTLVVNSGHPQIWAISSANSGGISGITEVTGSLFFSNIQNLVGGNSAGNTFTLNGGTLAGSITGGASGNNKLIAGNVANTWNITGNNAGTVTGVTGGFTQIQNITGGNQNDTFNFTDSGRLSGEIDGGSLAGHNILNYSAMTAPITVSLTSDYIGYTQNISNVTMHNFTNITDLVGDASGQSRLALTPIKTNVVTVNGFGTGFVNDPVNFSGFNSFVASGSNNTFYIAGPYTYNPSNGTVTAFGGTYTISNFQGVSGQNPTPTPTPTPSTNDSGSNSSSTTTTTTSSSTSSSTNSNTVQVVTSATINAQSQSTNAYDSENDNNNYDEASGGFVSSSPVVIVVNTSLNNMYTQQQTIDLLIGESQSFGSCK